MKRFDWRVASRVACLALLGSGPVWGQAAQPRAGALQALVRDAVRDIVAVRPPEAQFRVLPEPRFVIPRADGTYSFADFDRIPMAPAAAPGDVLALTNDELLNQLRRLDETIELSEPELTREQATTLESARRLLYEDANKREPTHAYRTWLNFEKRYNELGTQLADSKNTAARTGLQLQIRTTEQDWNTYGQRLRIAQALDTVARLSPEQTARLREAWHTAIGASSGADYGRVFAAIAGTSGWTALTLPVPAGLAAGRITLTRETGGTAAVSQDLPGVAQVSMRVIVWRIPRAALDHAFLRSPNWRSKQSFVISDGLATSASSELVPRVISALVIAKGLEVTFSSDDSWRAVVEALARNDRVSLGGLTLKAPRAAGPFSSPGYIASAVPFVFGVVVSEVSKSPNPSPDGDWPLIRW